jgi:hypothetical protein
MGANIAEEVAKEMFSESTIGKKICLTVIWMILVITGAYPIKMLSLHGIEELSTNHLAVAIITAYTLVNF